VVEEPYFRNLNSNLTIFFHQPNFTSIQTGIHLHFYKRLSVSAFESCHSVHLWCNTLHESKVRYFVTAFNFLYNIGGRWPCHSSGI
jgi:hypothetical protein